MANRNDKNPGNQPGPFYVDASCIDCDLCREIAPETFRRDNQLGMTITVRQPVTDDEVARARKAAENCPTNSIGDDGA